MGLTLLFVFIIEVIKNRVFIGTGIRCDCDVIDNSRKVVSKVINVT